MKTLSALLVVLLGSLAFGQSPVKTWDPGNIIWQRTDPDGSKWAVLEGDKDAPGKAFTYAFLVPAGHCEHHSHNQDARVAVISGALKVAVGPTLDKTGATTYPLEAFFSFPLMWSTQWGPRSTQSVSGARWDRGKRITMRKCIITKWQGQPSEPTRAVSKGEVAWSLAGPIRVARHR